MFKYIQEILEKIPIGQRLIALFILLISITIIYVTPKIVDALMYDSEHLIETSKQKDQWLRDSRVMIDSLYSQKTVLSLQNNELRIKLEETLNACSNDLAELRNKNKILAQNLKPFKNETEALVLNAAIDKTFDSVQFIPYTVYDTIYNTKQNIKKVQMKVLSVKPEKVSLFSRIFKPTFKQQQRQRIRLRNLKSSDEYDFILKDTFQIETVNDTIVIKQDKIDTIIKKDSD